MLVVVALLLLSAVAVIAVVVIVGVEVIVVVARQTFSKSTKQLKTVNYFSKKLYLKCLSGF